MPSATMAQSSILLVFVFFGGLASAFYEGRSPVAILSPTDFDRKVISDDGGIWLVEFYANWYVCCDLFKHLLLLGMEPALARCNCENFAKKIKFNTPTGTAGAGTAAH